MTAPLFSPFRAGRTFTTADAAILAAAYGAVAHPVRLQILGLLDAGSPMRVSDLLPLLGIRQSGVSRHLGILERAGLVAQQGDGYRVIVRDAVAGLARLLDPYGGRFSAARDATVVPHSGQVSA